MIYFIEACFISLLRIEAAKSQKLLIDSKFIGSTEVSKKTETLMRSTYTLF